MSRGGAVIGHRHAFFRQGRERIAHVRTGFEDDGGIGMIFLLYTVAIKDALHERWAVVIRGDQVGQRSLTVEESSSRRSRPVSSSVCSSVVMVRVSSTSASMAVYSGSPVSSASRLRR